MPAIKTVYLRDGTVRYRARCDVAPPRNGRRFQRTITRASRDEVETELARLTAYTRPRTRLTLAEQLETTGLIPATSLVAAGECTRECLFALEDTCVCRCGGQYHGKLQHLYLDAMVDTGVPASGSSPPQRMTITDADHARLLASRGLRAVRMQAGRTQEDVCQAAGGILHPVQLGRAERGKYGLSLAQLLALAPVLGLGSATLDDVKAWLARFPPSDGRLSGGHALPSKPTSRPAC